MANNHTMSRRELQRLTAMCVCGLSILTTGTQRAHAQLTPPTAQAATSITSTGFTANWSAVDGATGYMLDVYRCDGEPPITVSEGFNDYPTIKPEGWEFNNAGGYYDSLDSSGESPRSIKLSATGHSITTAEYPAAVTNLSFWYKGNGVGGSSFLQVSASNETGWTEIGIFTPANTATAQNYSLSTADAYTRFRLVYTKDKGNVAIDDVTVQYGTRVYTLTNEAVGAVTSYQVTNLVEGVYWYVVRATDGSEVTADSNVIKVNTAAEPPRIVPFTSQTARVGETFTCDVVIQETNDDPVTATNVTASAGISGAWSLHAGVFTYTPTAADRGERTFTFTAQDKDGWSEPRDLVITVLPACVPAVVMTGVSGTYSQTFEALGSYGGSTVWDNAAEPLHAWYAYVKNAPVTSFIYGTGSGTAGALYAFSFEGSNTYSLGSLAGGKRDYVYGMALTNASDNAVTECVIQSRSRQWRVGANSQTNTLLAEYCITNCVFPLHEEGVWHRLTALCFDSPLVTNELFQKGGPVTADISVPADGCVRLLRPIPPGGTLLLRWVDVDDTGNDHAFGIDHVNVAWTAGDMPAGILVPTNGITETFDEMGEHAADILPWSWRTKTSDSVRTTGAYADAETTVTHDNAAPGFTAAGSYNFASDGRRDQAVGGLTDNTQAQSVSIMARFTNGTSLDVRKWDVTFDVEKYRQGTAASAVRLLYGTDGVTWSEVGAPVVFGTDTEPGATSSAERRVEFSTPVVPGGTFYLAWQIAVAEGDAVADAQALAIDDVSVTPVKPIPGILITVR